MTALSSLPNFNKVSIEEKNVYELFFNYTSTENIQGYAQGWSLANLVHLAHKAYAVVRETNPILDENSPQTAVIPGRQWQLNRLSEIKRSLAQAIECKRGYYENHWFGKITQFFLKCFGMWNGGQTAAIEKAEDFLMMYDSRMPLYKSEEGAYRTRYFFFLVRVSWIREHLDTTQFFNYTPRRVIPVVENFHYATLDTRNPQIIIRG